MDDVEEYLRALSVADRPFSQRCHHGVSLILMSLIVLSAASMYKGTGSTFILTSPVYYLFPGTF